MLILALALAIAVGGRLAAAQHAGDPHDAASKSEVAPHPFEPAGVPAIAHIPPRRELTTDGQIIPKLHQLTLVAKKAADGSLTYDGTIPGPTIEIYEGDKVELTLVNELDLPVSVHVHGVHYDIDSDGTRMTGSFAPPGGKYLYRWTAAPGTAGYWHYHDHVVGPGMDGVRGIEQGLYGALIVRKPGDRLPDKTFVLVMQSVWFNNKRYPSTPLLEAKLGERVEFVVITHGSRFHTFHIHGHRWLDPGTNRIIDTFTQNAGESTGFQVVAGEGVGPGAWMYHCHVHDHLEDGMLGFFVVRP
ncbi:multicopper oxidase domain-containing protein [Bradyrhizobium erythrophlei]|uniref:multicopper oxidase domain-containing protein n=1 Tax=Bradyrhizobium erythrophlei TaxID=1437360 RepID=UPI0035F00063